MSIILPKSHYIGTSAIAGGGILLSDATAISAAAPAAPVVINMLASELDPRIKYTGPAHFYRTESGQLALSAENEWPVEYLDGEAVGRHEPEPAATNLQPYSRADTISDYLVKSDDLELIVDATGAPDGGAIGRIPIICESYLVSQDVDSITLVSQKPYALTDSWQRLAYAVTVTRRSRVRIRYGQHSVSTPSIWITQNPDYGQWLAAGDYAISWFAKAGDGVTFPAGFAQIEAGAVCTSPIVNDTAGKNSRAAAAASVDTTGFTSLRLIFSNGDEENYETAGNEFTLSPAAQHWGTRYIKTIELTR